MSSDAEAQRRSPAYRLIHHYRERATAAIQRYNEALVKGSVSEEHRRDLAAAALDYYSVLHEHRDEEALDPHWDERDIAWLEDLAGETVEMEQSLPRSNGATTSVERPAILAVDASRLRDLILELNDVAKELGFSARVEESTTRTEITDEMLDKVEEWRKANLE
jgi:hypothetical protein